MGGSIPSRSETSLQNFQTRLWGPSSFLFDGYHGFFLLPKLRMSEDISSRSLHGFMACTRKLPNGNAVKSLM